MFSPLLEDLVSKIEGAEGAILVDHDGEAVLWYASGDDELLRLKAAYMSMPVVAFRSSASLLGLGHVNRMILKYDPAWFIVEELDSGYFLMLELDSTGNLAQAINRVRPAVISLNAEIAV